MPDYSDIDPVSLKPYERRRYIAWRVLGSPGKVVQKELALELGVSETTVSHDMDSEEYLAAAGDVFREMIKKHLLPQAILNVARFMGKEAKSDKKPEVSIEMLKMYGGLLTNQAVTDDDKPATSLLEAIFAPSVVALQRENAELKARLAAIETRLGALNGQGKEILDGI